MSTATLEVPPELNGLVTNLAESSERMTALLAFALGLEWDSVLRDVMRRATGPGPRALALGEKGPFLELVDGALGGTGSMRGPASTALSAFDVPGALRRDKALATTVRTRLDESGAQSEAERLVDALLGDAERLVADDFRSVKRWSELLATEAYRHAVLTQMLIDEARGLVQDMRSDAAARWYWAEVHALSHTTLLAASTRSTEWLVSMSKTFEWRTWTPSFPLVRDRVGRLTLRGAWVAARFGVGVADSYLGVLTEARHPLRIFDAVLGLTAIALSSPADAPSIAGAMNLALHTRSDKTRDHNDALILAACARSSAIALRYADEAHLGHAGVDHAAKLFAVLDEEVDGAAIDGQGLMPSILALPLVTSRPAEAFFTLSKEEV